MSRTHLKQQLMREQLQQQERREANLRGRNQGQQQQQSHQQAHHSQKVLNAPAYHQQIMKIQNGSRLENPTNYHLIHSLSGTSSPQLDAQTQLSPLSQSSPSFVPLNSPQTPTQHPHQAHPSSSTSNSTQKGIHQTGQQPQSPFPLSPESPLSAPPSSASELDDVWDDLHRTLDMMPGLDMNEMMEPMTSIASTLPTDITMLTSPGGPLEESQKSQKSESPSLKLSTSCPPLNEAELAAWQKERQKKDNHNKIERKRRYNINDRIKELGTLLPSEDSPHHEIVRDMKQNKGTILKASVDYMRALQKENEMKDQRIRDLELENRLLKDKDGREVSKKALVSVEGGQLLQTLIPVKSNSPFLPNTFHQQSNSQANWMNNQLQLSQRHHQQQQQTNYLMSPAMEEGTGTVDLFGVHNSQLNTIIKQEYCVSPSQSSSGLGSMSSPSPLTSVLPFNTLAHVLMEENMDPLLTATTIKSEIYSPQQMDICN